MPGIFTYGKSVPAYETKPGIMAYLRLGGGQTILSAGNYGGQSSTPKLEGSARKVLLSTLGKEAAVQMQAEKDGTITLESCEGAGILS